MFWDLKSSRFHVVNYSDQVSFKLTGTKQWRYICIFVPWLTCILFCNLQSHYHVVFFDERVSRAWIKTDHVCQYTGNEEVDGVVHSVRFK